MERVEFKKLPPLSSLRFKPLQMQEYLRDVNCRHLDPSIPKPAFLTVGAYQKRTLDALRDSLLREDLPLEDLQERILYEVMCLRKQFCINVYNN